MTLTLWDQRLSTPHYFVLTLAFAVTMALLVTIATAHKPAVILKNQAALSTKADREPIIRTIPISKPVMAVMQPPVQQPPVPVRVVTELPLPPEAPSFKERDLLEPGQEPEPEIHRRWRQRRHFAEHGDICTRHGMHKVVSHNGKSWRCR